MTTIDDLRRRQEPMQQPIRPINPRMPRMRQEDTDISTGDGFEYETETDILSKDINDSIDDLPQQKKKVVHEEKKEKLFDKIPAIFREPLLLLLIYIILSMDITKKTLAHYIPQIKPTESGEIQFMGILFYGLILTILFIILKRLLL